MTATTVTDVDYRIAAPRNPAECAAITDAVTTVLTAAFHDGLVARWLTPDPTTRPALSQHYFHPIVTHAVEYGTVRLAITSTGLVAGAALWLPWPPPPAATAQANSTPGPADQPPVDAALDAVTRRLAILDGELTDRHPTDTHQYLQYLGVHPSLHHRGIGSGLLTDHHQFLDHTGLPAYLEANDPRNRDLYQRHGYTALSRHIVLPDGPTIWPMWRHPNPADNPGPQHPGGSR